LAVVLVVAVLVTMAAVVVYAERLMHGVASARVAGIETLVTPGTEEI
jgi:hypothetical protein